MENDINSALSWQNLLTETVSICGWELDVHILPFLNCPEIEPLIRICFDLQEAQTQDFLQSSLGFLNSDSSFWIVVREKGRLIATTSFSKFHSSVYIFNLAVDLVYRGNGFGGYCLHQVEKAAVLLGVSTLSGTVDRQSPHLFEYYKKFGGKEIVAGFGSDGPPRLARFEFEVNATCEQITAKQVCGICKQQKKRRNRESCL